ncbi:TPA: hypothetical protein SL473_000365 [Pseudomonas aeruginosa]|uniref:hypothetical protein n=1 Tax=Pseudomonas aeruginosa TaxID=287 RepID=UPI00129069F1|nr:hypothetical protein [Pseudomonas aeruginosa]MBG5410228.1 hypothetical protein [Pseudomonas aeruginosa]MBG5453711.1 hypothetical protein [Pseudomonas aeruginosa]HEJ3981732.1 hypothetical protein [Pseudomonas aeruginosa]
MEIKAMQGSLPLTRNLLVAALLLAGAAQGAAQDITALLDDSVTLYVQKDDYFVKEQDVASRTLHLPSPVLAENRGYVKTTQQGREVWLDQLDVTLYPPKSVGESGCIPTNEGNTARTGRGAGEPCR